MENLSGVEPLLDRVLVLPDEIEEVSEGGIFIPEKVKEQHQNAQAAGILVAVGKGAFVKALEVVYDSNKAVKEIRELRYPQESCPEVGDRVMFARYGGIDVVGEDGKKYRILNDRDITLLASEKVTYTGIQSRQPILGETA